MEKFKKFIGTFVLKVIGLVFVIALTCTIVEVSYEAEKEDIFFEASDYFNTFFEIQRDMIYEQNGLLHHDNIKNELPTITNI